MSILAASLWRLRRLMLARRKDTALAPAGAIESYSVFQGVLHIKGLLDGDIIALTLHLPSGERLPVSLEHLAGRVAFEQRLPVRADPVEVAASVLVATFRDGFERRFADLGGPSGDPAHAVSARFRAALGEREPGALLEIGSRARSGLVRRDWAPPGWSYSGFDIIAGPNVDVVGDAHALSRHYPEAAFDAVMAFSVLEHLLMPWKFVLELNRVLKPAGIGLFTTHQSWPLHEQPWDFWRFSDQAWTALLNPATGFEIVEARMGEPAFIVAQRCNAATAFADRPAAALASFVMFRKIGTTRLEWPVELATIIDTKYEDTR